MSKKEPISSPNYSFSPTELEGFDSLAELALDMRSAWNHAADNVWRRLDETIWERTHNPWVVLQTVSRKQLESLLSDAEFCEQLSCILQDRKSVEKAPAWFQQHHSQESLTHVAYFSMEFMLSESLPIYSGGLGNVAGDQLKSASDLGVPVVGVGLLYQRGYFRQMIDKYGEQQALYPFNDTSQLPIAPLRKPNGAWLRVEIALPGYTIWLRTWQVNVGRVKLYLLDANDPANFPAHRGITSELYGGGQELRLKQELVLGIGGWRLLRALDIQPEICHLNEGHAAFAILERALCFMEETGQSFEVALAVTRAGNLFTTHTPVEAGFDRFAPDLIELYLGGYAKNRLGITVHDLLALGRQNPNDATESFNMTYLAARGCGAINGVSRLHGEVSRSIFQPLFPRWPRDEVPVGHVTNGVHMTTWDSKAADELWTEACGKNRWRVLSEALDEEIRRVPDEKLWQMRATARKVLIDYARERLEKQLISSGMPSKAKGVNQIFNPNTLTLGFARRFATYKRPNLLLHKPERLIRLLSNPERPAQLIIAGKSHPADQSGRSMISEWIHFILKYMARNHVMFLSDYDMLLAEQLVHGVDVWINTPRRPWEASGTSGMKVLVNGGINLSELDGWWAEAYNPQVGWALGDGREHGEDPAWDAAEAEALYDLLEHEVIPEFYDRNEEGIPTAWVARMRESMAQLTPRFSANRAVYEYTEQHYLPAAASYRERAHDKGEAGAQLVNWRQALERNWDTLHFYDVNIESDGEEYVFEIQVYLNDLDPNFVRVELFANGLNGDGPVRQEMTRLRPLEEAASVYVYEGRVSATRPASDYTARIIPNQSGVAVPLEASYILWQR